MFLFFFNVLIYILCVLCFFIVLCIVSPHAYSCFSSIYAQIHWQQPPTKTQLSLIDIISYIIHHLKLKWSMYRPWRYMGRDATLLHPLLTSKVDGSEWSTYHQQWYILPTPCDLMSPHTQNMHFTVDISESFTHTHAHQCKHTAERHAATHARVRYTDHVTRHD
jgi:hypothetical protein